MASVIENKHFTESLIGTYPLDIAIEWIKSSLTPEDVFGKQSLIEYIRSNFTVDDVFTDHDILQYVSRNFTPEDIS